MLLSGIFDPFTLKVNLETCLKGREQIPKSHTNSNQWLVDWNDWSDKSISDKIKKWRDKKCVATEAQLKFTAYVLCYMEIMHRAFVGHNSKLNPLPIGFPWFGPIFTPPSIEYRALVQPANIRASQPFQDKPQKTYIQDHSILNDPEQFFIEPVIVISPVFFPHLQLDKCPHAGCTSKITKHGFTSTGPRTVYGVEFNLKAIGVEYSCSVHGFFSTMGSNSFWKEIPPWKCDNIPFFQERSACTRELFDLVVELRPRLSIGGITETIRQLHIQYDRRLEKRWLAGALAEKERYPDRPVQDFPMQTLTLVSGAVKKINPSPSGTFFRELYDFFIEKQRREESSQYTRTLAGLAIGMDATIKIAKKANIYIPVPENKTKVVNVFDGGLLTGVNEDKELVICELLSTASPFEMISPLREFAERCEDLGVPFGIHGEVCVDRCCSFRSALQIAIPNIIVSQDLAHLKNRIMETVSKKSLHRKALGTEISNALISQPSTKKGEPPKYRLPSQQMNLLGEVWKKYSSFSGVWTAESETVFAQQVKHVSNGCLQRRDPSRMSTTSYNENIHKQLNRLSIGQASSLTTIEGLLMDAMLRYNLRIAINHMSQAANSPSRRFRQEANGSHHLFLLENNFRQREHLTGLTQPEFLKIRPDHKFALVARESGISISKRYSKLKANLVLSMEQEAEGDDEEQVEKQEEEDEEFVFTMPDVSGEDSIDASSSEMTLESNKALITTASTSIMLPNMDVLEDSTSPSSSATIKRPYVHESIETFNKIRIVEKPSSPQPTHYSPPIQSLSIHENDFNSDVASTNSPLPEMLSAALLPPVSRTISSSSQSRTMQTYASHTNTNIVAVLSQTTIDTGTPGYFRFGALRIQERWVSTMTDEQWHQASQIYNDKNTFIHPMYHVNHPLPIDPILRNIQALKNCCRKYEDSVWQWRADEQRGEGITEWKKQQISLVIPARTVTISKQGRQMAAKVCQRCHKPKVGQGKDNHKRDFCGDGFPIWNRVPHPLPDGLVGRRVNGKISVDPTLCLCYFSKLAEIQANGNNILCWREDQIQNLGVFEALARRPEYSSQELKQVILRGTEAYCFEPHVFKK